MANWFVGFKISPDGWYSRVVSLLPEETRIFHREDIHLTVAFLGDIKTELVPSVIDCMKGLEFSPLTLHSDKLIALPSARHFSAICLDFTNLHTDFGNLMDSWKVAICKAAQIQPDPRKFLAHATICRPPRKLTHLHHTRMYEQIKIITDLGISTTLETLALYTWADERGNPQSKRQFKTVFEKNFV